MVVSCSTPPEKNVQTPKEATSNSSSKTESNFVKEKFPGTDQLKFEGHKRKGAPDGFCKFYHRNGKLKIETHFEYGLFNGFYKSFYENGNQKEEGNYSKGEKTGVWKYFDKEGNQIREENF